MSATSPQLFDAYFTKTGHARDMLAFFFRGQRLMGTQTPANFEMANGDVINTGPLF